MHDIATRIVENLGDRVTGPMKFRIVLQPLMSCFFAVRAGLKDAKTGRPPYFWGMISHREERRNMLKDGWHSVGKIFVLALVLDTVYQFIVIHHLYIGEALIVAFLLAIVPYLLLRGIVTRVANLASRGRRPPAPVS